jgi:DNA gyrase subunit A
MDILPAQVVAQIATDDGSDEEPETEEELTTANAAGPWALAITTGGLGKRVPITSFRLQNRAGMGVKAIKFRKKDDQLATLQVVGADDELMIITNRGIIIRQSVGAITPQSRQATGVKVQKLDEDDAIAAVALVPPSPEEEEASE